MFHHRKCRPPAWGAPSIPSATRYAVAFTRARPPNAGDTGEEQTQVLTREFTGDHGWVGVLTWGGEIGRLTGESPLDP